MKRSLLFGFFLFVACAPSPGGGSRSVAPTSGSSWDPRGIDRAEVPPAPPAVATPDLIARRNALTLIDVVDVALQNNPTTRISWANARAAAARLGAARGGFLPTATVDLRATKLQTAGTQGTNQVQQQTYGITGSFTWLLFDFNRGADIGAAPHAQIG